MNIIFEEGIMNSDKLWNEFEKTGTIYNYLKYKKAYNVEYEISDELNDYEIEDVEVED